VLAECVYRQADIVVCSDSLDPCFYPLLKARGASMDEPLQHFINSGPHRPAKCKECSYVCKPIDLP
jgi:hypothetical protein